MQQKGLSLIVAFRGGKSHCLYKVSTLTNDWYAKSHSLNRMPSTQIPKVG